MSLSVQCLQAGRRLPGKPWLQVIFWWCVVSNIVLLLLKVFYRIRLEGKANVPSEQPVIYLANHQSYLDPPIVGVLVMDRPFASLARENLFRNRMFAWLIRQLGAIPLKQGRGDAGAMKSALDELDAGRNVLLFPEGSRTPDGAVHRFQRGVLLLIKRAKVPIVPIAIEGAHDIWPTGRRRPRLSGRLAVRAGAPIPHDELMREGGDAALERLRRDIDTMRLELRQRLRDETGGRHPAPGAGDHPGRATTEEASETAASSWAEP